MKKIVFIFFIFWLFFTAVGAGVGYFVFNLPRINHLVEKGVPIYGKVIATEPEQHQGVIFTYEVNGMQYSGNGNAGRGNPDFDQIQIGQKVVVFYDSENPENSILGYPQLYQGSEKFGILFCAIFFPIFPMIVIIGSFLLYRMATTKKVAINY